MKIILVRHGQSVSDIENRYGGSYDDHLTDEGKIQAERLAQNLKDQHIKKIYFSPLHRAKETALILQKKLKSELTEIASLAERNKYGILTGMLKSEAQKTYPQLVALLENDHNTIIDAEPFERFKIRILSTVDTITKNESQSLAIITHGGPIKVILEELFERRVKTISDCAYAVIEKTNSETSLQKTEGITIA